MRLPKVVAHDAICIVDGNIKLIDWSWFGDSSVERIA